MAKITGNKVKEIKERILHGGSYLELEAFDLHVPVEELKYAIRRSCNGGEKSSEYKAILRNSETTASRIPKQELAQMKIISEPVKKSQNMSTPVLEERIPAEKVMSEPMTSAVTIPDLDPMDALLIQKEKLEEEIESLSYSLEKANEILSVRLETEKKAKSALQRALALAKNAEADVVCAHLAVTQIEQRVADAQDALKEVFGNIEELKVNTIWLIDPWYSGEMPGYGTCFSVVEREGVTIQKVDEDYLPEARVEDILMFDLVPDYRKAREFCGLVAMFELEGKSYKLCVGNDRVKALLKMYIG